ncbi:Integrase catalytic core protein, partial [Phytophthora palmivora]
MEHLRVFGSQGYAHVDDAKRTKLEPKSFRCMFLGYAENAKGYRVFALDASKVKVSRSVKLDEREVGGIYESPSFQPQGTVINLTKDTDDGTVPTSMERQHTPDIPMEDTEETVPDVEMNEGEHEPNAQAFREERLVFQPEMERLRRPREPVFLLENGSDGGEYVQSEGSDSPPSPKRARIDEEGLIAEAVMAYAANIVDAADVPTSYAEATASPDAAKWRSAMAAELRSHEKNATWTLVPRGNGKRTIGCRWVFTKKRDENGCVIRYKARLVAKGFKQKYGYIMEQLDADTAFLNSVLMNRVYMEMPDGTTGDDDQVCLLGKAIYGLKQAAMAWNKTIHRVFLRNGFKSCGADQCVYVKRSRNGYMYVCLYVDDMIIAAKTAGEIREVKDSLKAEFKMKELGAAKFILGMEIDHNLEAGTLMIKQTRYIDDVTERFGQQNAKPVDNPCASGLKLSKEQSPGTDVERTEMR